MASGLVAPSGLDLDSVLAPLGSFTARAAVGFITSAGTDASSRYAPAIYGTAAAAVGFISAAAGGVDIGPLYAALGTTGAYSGTLTAVSVTGGIGYRTGFGGSISPTTFRGNTIRELYVNTSGQTLFDIAIASNPGSNYFTQLVLNGHTLTTASATYTYTGGVALWTWSTTAFSSVATYPVSIT